MKVLALFIKIKIQNILYYAYWDCSAMLHLRLFYQRLRKTTCTLTQDPLMDKPDGSGSQPTGAQAHFLSLLQYGSTERICRRPRWDFLFGPWRVDGVLGSGNHLELETIGHEGEQRRRVMQRRRDREKNRWYSWPSMLLRVSGRFTVRPTTKASVEGRK